MTDTLIQQTEPVAVTEEIPPPKATAPVEKPFFGFGLEGLAVFGGFLLIGLMGLISDRVGSHQKSVLSSAKWANRKDREAARKRAHQQLASGQHDEISLWINSPKLIEGTTVRGDLDTVWITDAARGTSVIGGSGSGKSFSVVKPTLRSAVAQGLPIILLDTDYPGLTKTIAPLAESVGYDVSIFAPGYPESQVCNVVDFVSDHRDATGASQISKTIHKNFSDGGNSSEDKFFQVSGELATEASILLAKALKYPDILMAFAILKDEDMLKRVRGVGSIDPWLELSFGQLLSTAKSEKTVDSIRGTAALLFGQLMRPDILPALIGKTSIPLEITGKKLLVFGVKQDIRLVVSPLIAAVIHAIVTRNVLPGRTEPLFLSLDELPSMFFPEIAEWLSEKRKYGLCTQIGYQSIEQLKKRYGPELADVIYTNTATKFFFNPQSIASARIFSETLGEEDVVYNTRGHSYGKSRSRSRTQHRTKKRLFTPDEFMGLREGSCVLLSPGCGEKSRKFVPIKFDPLKITQRELDIQQTTEQEWDGFVERAISKGVGKRKVAPIEIKKRVEELHQKLPLTKVKEPSTKNLADILSDI